MPPTAPWPDPELLVTDTVTAETEAIIEGGLSDFNKQQAGYVDSRTLAVLIRNRTTHEIAGGLLGRSILGLLFIDLVYLPAWARGQGLGSRVLALAEEEAVRRGCTTAVLFTITFQAPEFYARYGYQELGRVECPPPGHTRICMTKRLAAIPSPAGGRGSG